MLDSTPELTIGIPWPTVFRYNGFRFFFYANEVIGVPLAWFPRLLNASPEQRTAVRISSRGLHWDAIDEDISIAGLLDGLRDQTLRTAMAA